MEPSAKRLRADSPKDQQFDKGENTHLETEKVDTPKNQEADKGENAQLETEKTDTPKNQQADKGENAYLETEKTDSPKNQEADKGENVHLETEKAVKSSDEQVERSNIPLTKAALKRIGMDNAVRGEQECSPSQTLEGNEWIPTEITKWSNRQGLACVLVGWQRTWEPICNFEGNEELVEEFMEANNLTIEELKFVQKTVATKKK